VKVDSVLRCPIFDSNDKQVFDIDGVLTQYYSESDDECDADNKRDSDSESESDYESDDDNDNDDNDRAVETEVDPEFEILEEVNEAR
jgi:uncharacterized protein (DUF2225 family)